jgi:hypothetical protein
LPAVVVSRSLLMMFVGRGVDSANNNDEVADGRQKSTRAVLIFFFFGRSPDPGTFERMRIGESFYRVTAAVMENQRDETTSASASRRYRGVADLSLS